MAKSRREICVDLLKALDQITTGTGKTPTHFPSLRELLILIYVRADEITSETPV